MNFSYIRSSMCVCACACACACACVCVREREIGVGSISNNVVRKCAKHRRCIKYTFVLNKTKQKIPSSSIIFHLLKLTCHFPCTRGRKRKLCFFVDFYNNKSSPGVNREQYGKNLGATF